MKGTRYFPTSLMQQLFRCGLLLALLVGALHVALHGLEGGALSAQDDCQICRLAHSPVVDLPLLVPLLVALWLGFQLPLFPVSQPARIARRLGWARAPPQI